MEYGAQEYGAILNEFKRGVEWLNDVTIEIPGEINELSPLTLLRAYEEEVTVENSTSLASEMVLNKLVRFKKGGKVILEFVFTGGDLADKFIKQPYLFNLLLKMCYGLMVKKLTPPSEDSETEEQQ